MAGDVNLLLDDGSATRGEEPVRLAPVGLGSWADVLARAAGRGDVIELVNCYSRTPEKREAFSERHGIPRKSTSYDELLADERVEGVIICTPNSSHVDLALAALDAGKAVYVDKPIAHTVDDARRLVEATGDAIVAVGHAARRLGPHRLMKALCESGELGPISLAEANFSNPRGVELSPESWRYHEHEGPGGVLVQLGVHHADTMQHLFGPVVSVSAWTRRQLTKATVPDLTVVLMEFESGTVGYLGNSWAGAGHYSMQIYGLTAGVDLTAPLTNWVTPHRFHSSARMSLWREGTAAVEELVVPPSDMLREELEEFAAAIRGRGSIEVGPVEGLQALAVIECAMLSASRAGCAVPLAEVLD